MMSVYVITGKLGGGKTLTAIHLITKYLSEDRRVATNLDLHPENFRNKKNKKANIIRVPDKPKASQLIQLGHGYDGEYQGEERNGLLVLDELGTWFNSRNWQDKTRKSLIDWMLHARKFRWDLVLIIQNIDMLDKQARVSIAEHTVWMRRLDKMRIPFIGVITKTIGYEIRPPKYHRAVVKYGDTQQHPTVDTWMYSGKKYYDYYDTEQTFIEDEEQAMYSYLTPWHLVGRYEKKTTYIDYLNKYLMPIIRITLIPYCVISEALRPHVQAGGRNA
jgi:hypothetical protein